MIDRTTIITGSFSFTQAAEENNAENLLIIKGYSDLSKKYRKNYDKHRADARKHKGPKPRKPKADNLKKKDEPRAKPPPQEAPDPIVYVTDSGSKYHRGSCSYLRKSRIPMKLSAAKRRYSPCSRCHPPT